MLTPEQKEARRKGIGGSDLAAIAGLNPYKSRFDIYLEKIGQDGPVIYNYPTRVGSFLESFIADEYQRLTGHSVTVPENQLSHPKYPWMLANIDRWVNNKEFVLECKTAGEYSAKAWGNTSSDDIPELYLLQCAHYAAVCDVPKVDIAVLIGNNKFYIYTYNRNLKLENRIIEIEYDFWHNHVLKKQAPEPVTIYDCQKLYMPEENVSWYAEKEDEATLYEIRDAKQKIKQLEDWKKSLEDKLKMKFKKASILYDGFGKKLATYKKGSRKYLDSQLLLKEKPDIYEYYSRVSDVWTFRITGE